MYITGRACIEHNAYEGTAFEELVPLPNRTHRVDGVFEVGILIATEKVLNPGVVAIVLIGTPIVGIGKTTNFIL
jgi:hypothetical protein